MLSEPAKKTEEKECACFATVTGQEAYKNFQCYFNEDDKKKKKTVGPYFQWLFVVWLSYFGRLVKVIFTSAHSMHRVCTPILPRKTLLRANNDDQRERERRMRRWQHINTDQLN